MPNIRVLDQVTIDKIAAGEVIERPASIVKELAENAIDAGASAIFVEIKDGGKTLIRISDNGCGIRADEVPVAFLRHSTSKIRSADDLLSATTLGFRGEALSSICAVSKVELVTKTSEDETGVRYRIEGGVKKGCDECAARDGSTFSVRDLFYNTPARKKFLKSDPAEAGHVQDVLLHLALSHPEISFELINDGRVRLNTSGNGRLKDAVYSLFGRDTALKLIEVNSGKEGLSLSGFIGEPALARGNRGSEYYFVNGRYVTDRFIAKAIEDAYKARLMRREFPFAVLLLRIDESEVDVNVHPSKMQLRFKNPQRVYDFVCDSVKAAFSGREVIPDISLGENNPLRAETSGNLSPRDKDETYAYKSNIKRSADSAGEEIFGRRGAGSPAMEEEPASMAKPAGEASNQNPDLDYYMGKMRERVLARYTRGQGAGCVSRGAGEEKPVEQINGGNSNELKEDTNYKVNSSGQAELFDENFLTGVSSRNYRIIGQVFETYWLIENGDKLYIIDQHAAHERVLYERTLQSLKTREYTSQLISPPIVLNLSMREEDALLKNMDTFRRIGFEIEPFGDDSSYAVSAVPGNLYHIAKEELLKEMLDELADEINPKAAPDIISAKIASASCKAAVKGNMTLSEKEAKALIADLLTLENPYQCPHGRPAIISLSRRELEKKFRRIV